MVAALLPNVPEYPMVILGALSGGLILTTLNPLYTAGNKLQYKNWTVFIYSCF